jgi:hypothetical protein
MNTWDEKKSIELKTNSENFIGSINETTTNAIKKDCEKTVCENTGRTRNCPICNKVIIYTNKYNCKYAKRDKRPCRECKEHDPIMLKRLHQGNVGRKQSQEHIEKSRLSRLGYKHTEHWKNEARIRMSGKKFPPEFGEAISKRMMGNKNSTNKPKPKHWKEKLIAKMARSYQEPDNIGKSFLPNYNKTACEYFDWLNKFMGWNGQYATSGGEKNILIYFVDYYEPSLNIVIEWDEPHHKKQIIEDNIRKDEIKKCMGCKFFRYESLTNTIIEV